MSKLTTYDSATARAIAQFVRDQKRQAPRRLNNDLTINRNPRVIRWAKATTNAQYPTYPTSGTVFIAQLGDYEINDTAVVEPSLSVSRTFTEYGTASSDYVIVICSDGTSLPTENDKVRIELHDGQWIYHRDTATANPRNNFHAYTIDWYGTIPNGGSTYAPMWDSDSISQSAGMFTTNGAFDTHVLKSLVSGLMLATFSATVDYVASGSSTDGCLIGCVWESTGTWYTGGTTQTGITKSYVRYATGCITHTTMFQVAEDQEIWLRLSTATGFGYFWGTTSDMTVDDVTLSIVHLTDNTLTP